MTATHIRSRDAFAPELCQGISRISPNVGEMERREAPKSWATSLGPRHAGECCHSLALRAWRAPQDDPLARTACFGRAAPPGAPPWPSPRRPAAPASNRTRRISRPSPVTPLDERDFGYVTAMGTSCQERCRCIGDKLEPSLGAKIKNFAPARNEPVAGISCIFRFRCLHRGVIAVPPITDSPSHDRRGRGR